MNFFSAILLASVNVSAPAVDNGLMTNVPNIGPSRIESVSYCLKSVGVDKYQDLITDSEFSNFEGCLRDLT
jgi:hypothetical protein